MRWLGKVWPGERCKNIKPESEEERKRVKEIWDKNPSGFSSSTLHFATLNKGGLKDESITHKEGPKLGQGRGNYE